MTEDEIIAELRKYIPIDGDEWTYLWRLRVLPGSSVASHVHAGWTASYYKEVGEGGAVIRGTQRLTPRNGDIIVFPPLIPHSVEENTGSIIRLSYALTVNEGDNRQVRKDVIR